MEMTDWAFYALGGLFILQGILHLARTRVVENYAIDRGFVSARQSVMLSGFLLIVAGIALMVPTIRTYGIYALLLFLAISTFAFHRFWEHKNGQLQWLESMHFVKNLMLMLLLFTLLSMV
jgi:putative oxidoreductase